MKLTHSIWGVPIFRVNTVFFFMLYFNYVKPVNMNKPVIKAADNSLIFFCSFFQKTTGLDFHATCQTKTQTSREYRVRSVKPHFLWKKNQRTDSPKSLLACKVLMECCVSSMQFYTIHAKKIDDIPMLPILYDKMELYGIYQASGHCTSWIEDFL